MRYLVLLFLITANSFAASQVGLELGEASSSYNQIKIPGKGGTQFSAADALNPAFYYRLSFLHHFESSKHGLRLLYAPLKLKGEQTYNRDINFQGVNFPGTQETDVEYQFNSYRASYFYNLIYRPELKLNIGATLKVRDAKVKLSQNGISKTKSNTGLVPLIYLYSEYMFQNGLKLALDFDGLIAPQGRAIDAALMLGYDVASGWEINTGVRMLEGGADNDKVYNFSQINYFFVGAKFNF